MKRREKWLVDHSRRLHVAFHAYTGALFSPYGGIVHDCAAIMHHTAPWYLPWGLKLVPLPISPGHPASGIPNPGLHLLAPLPGIYAPEPRKVREIFAT